VKQGGRAGAARRQPPSEEGRTAGVTQAQPQQDCAARLFGEGYDAFLARIGTMNRGLGAPISKSAIRGAPHEVELEFGAPVTPKMEVNGWFRDPIRR